MVYSLFKVKNKDTRTTSCSDALIVLLPLNDIVIRKTTGFKTLQLNYWEINHATSKCQTDVWTKFAKNV